MGGVGEGGTLMVLVAEGGKGFRKLVYDSSSSLSTFINLHMRRFFKTWKNRHAHSSVHHLVWMRTFKKLSLKAASMSRLLPVLYSGLLPIPIFAPFRLWFMYNRLSLAPAFAYFHSTQPSISSVKNETQFSSILPLFSFHSHSPSMSAVVDLFPARSLSWRTWKFSINRDDKFGNVFAFFLVPTR